MDYFFEAQVCCREVKDRVEVFEDFNRDVLTIQCQECGEVINNYPEDLQGVNNYE